MNKKSTLLVVVFCFCFSLLYAQDNAISNAINKNNIQLEKKSSISSNNTEKDIIPFRKGWAVGFTYGLTQFDGDIRQYDHYPAYQETGSFFELKSAVSLSVNKKINPCIYNLFLEYTDTES